MSTQDEKDQQHNEFSSRISDEINCSICLDILVNPLTLAPCGHSFCTSCCLSDSTKNGKRRRTLCFNKCPQCRQPIKETAPSRQLENLIDTLATVPNLLFSNEDDKKQYLKRKGLENKQSRILTSPARPKKRRRQDGSPPNISDFAASTNTDLFHGPLTNHYNHGRQDVYSSGYALSTNHRGRHHASTSFDPMVAPLPPPFDFATMGESFSGPSEASSRSRGSTSASRNTSGISASDPICID